MHAAALVDRGLDALCFDKCKLGGPVAAEAAAPHADAGAVDVVARMEMIDGGDSDYKVIAVTVDDKRWDDVKDLKDINKHNLKEYQHFFETYKVLKGKKNEVVVHGFKGRKDALVAVKRSVKLYEKEFGKL